jgi:mannose-6-phosphate isomerase-like protein (cupin superfamily)
MEFQQKLVFKIADVPTVEAPDGGMRNNVMVTEETCGATAFSAGILTVHPGGKSCVDCHEVQELYYVISGTGIVTVGDVPNRVEAGDMMFLPEKITHDVVNDGKEPLAIVWVTGETWSRLPDIRDVLGTWPVVG